MIAVQNRIGSNIKRLRATLERFQGGRDILRSPNFESNNIEANRAGRGLSFAHFQHRGGIAGIGHDRQMAQTGDNLAQEFEPLAGKIGGLGRQAGDVVARSRQAWYEAGADRTGRGLGMGTAAMRAVSRPGASSFGTAMARPSVSGGTRNCATGPRANARFSRSSIFWGAFMRTRYDTILVLAFSSQALSPGLNAQ